jgi:hypothetical protein
LEMEVCLTICPDWPQIGRLISASQVTRITGRSHWCWFCYYILNNFNQNFKISPHLTTSINFYFTILNVLNLLMYYVWQ